MPYSLAMPKIVIHDATSVGVYPVLGYSRLSTLPRRKVSRPLMSSCRLSVRTSRKPNVVSYTSPSRSIEMVWISGGASSQKASLPLSGHSPSSTPRRYGSRCSICPGSTMPATPSGAPMICPCTRRQPRRKSGRTVRSVSSVWATVRLISPVMPFQLLCVSGLVKCPPRVG